MNYLKRSTRDSIREISFLVLMLSVFGSTKLFGQTWSYPEYTMEGTTIWHTFPPPDSTFYHTRLVIKFRKGALDYTQLCYDCSSIISTGTREKGGARTQSLDPYGYFADCKTTLMTQHFGLDVILDPTVRTILESHGVTYLHRMTAANPCVDTLTISRNNDTLPMDHFDWMIAEFSDSTSVIPTLVNLFLSFNAAVEIAEPDYIYEVHTRVPVDPEFASRQPNLIMMGMDTAWGYEVGLDSIVVAVVDNGVDYWRCDLGWIKPSAGNKKVIGGWDYPGYVDIDTAHTYHPPSEDGIFHDAWHGTQVASILAALTNNLGCPTGGPHGMAGIGGGFGPAGFPLTPDLGTGLSLIAYNCNGVGEHAFDPGLDGASISSAILEASAHSAYGLYGFGVDVINFSGGGPNFVHSLSMHNAVVEAHRNAATLVASKGDINGFPVTYPSNLEPSSEVIAVGGSDRNKIRQQRSAKGIHLDLIAPGGETAGIDTIARALQWTIHDSFSGPSMDQDSFAWFGETSAAAPHVSGVVGLLKGHYRFSLHDTLAREDAEGMLKASALDIVTNESLLPAAPVDPDTIPGGLHVHYTPGFDERTGWGFVQPNTLFQMLDPAKGNYSLDHIEIKNSVLVDSLWSGKYTNVMFFAATPDSGKIPDSTAYDVEVREVVGMGSYAGKGFDTTKKLYVWGNTGLKDFKTIKRGLPNLLPNWQEPWCEVTSGQYGLGMPHDTNYVPGIRHEYSTTVKMHTYQFKLFKPGHMDSIGLFPADSNLGMGFTVFGAKALSSGVQSAFVKNESFSVWPSLASNRITVNIGDNDYATHFVLTDAIGREIESRELDHQTREFNVNTEQLASGLYIAVLTTRTGVESAKIIIRH